MTLNRKLAILADAAKYDASCASSGTSKRDSVGGRGIGSTEGMGICHSYAPDGRCISLLKILLTNYCLYDCQYCVNRVSSNVPRARFTAEEVVQLTLDFYRRNCIEGLFLSSGIIRDSDYTMEQVVEVARSLREDHDFRGYIHLKTIPDASDDLLARAGKYADRLSINVELPTTQSLHALAPEKDSAGIRRSMARLRVHIDNARDDARSAAQPATASTSRPQTPPRRAAAPRFAPGGQSTQMIVGADATDDRTILTASATLYGSYRLRRVYYSAFSPIPDAARALPLSAPPMMREHRLYQADWLMRFYGFEHHEIVSAGDGMLDLDIDPKLAWALAHREKFPVDLNRAPKELLLRVPGLGVKTIERLLQTRRVRRLRLDDLSRLHVSLKKIMPFICLLDHHPGRTLDAADLAQRLRPPPAQGGLFDAQDADGAPTSGLAGASAQSGSESATTTSTWAALPEARSVPFAAADRVPGPPAPSQSGHTRSAPAQSAPSQSPSSQSRSAHRAPVAPAPAQRGLFDDAPPRRETVAA